MTVLVLVFGAAILLLTLMVVHSYSGRDTPRPMRRARAGHRNGADSPWMFVGSDASASDCSPGDAGGGCDGGGGGGGD